MDDTSPSPFATPKRKRVDVANEDAPLALNTPFSFEVSQGVLPDGGGSPRTSVAHRFRGLALVDDTSRSGGGVSAPAPADGRHGQGHGLHGTDIADWAMMEIDGDESKMRKRTRLSPTPSSPGPQKQADRTEIPETPYTPEAQQTASADPGYLQPHFAPMVHLQRNSLARGAADPTAFTSSPLVSPDEPSKPSDIDNTRPAELPLKLKSRKRAGTPPLVATTTRAGNVDQAGDPTAEIIDPVRAALTWHEDEITVYDPEDKDDDGTGINGIGFKPTPAIAYARTMKRKQQLAEYKKREEREARARRSSRRRGSAERAPKLERKPSVRKVRFTETDGGTMITI